jgi:hypothetical protein
VDVRAALAEAAEAPDAQTEAVAEATALLEFDGSINNESDGVLARVSHGALSQRAEAIHAALPGQRRVSPQLVSDAPAGNLIALRVAELAADAPDSVPALLLEPVAGDLGLVVREPDDPAPLRVFGGSPRCGVAGWVEVPREAGRLLPLEPTELVTTDRGGFPLPRGVSGELAVSGEAVARLVGHEERGGVQRIAGIGARGRVGEDGGAWRRG